MKSRILIATGVGLSLALLAAGCGGSSGDNAGDSDGDSVGVNGKTILVGGTAPLSGSYAVYAAEAQGAEAYFNMVNKAGGVNGYKIEYKVYDDQYNPGTALTQVKKLVESDKVFALVNEVGTSSNSALLPYYKSHPTLPVVAPGAGGDLFAQAGFMANVFPVGPKFEDEAALLTNYAVDELGAKSVSLAYEDDAVGQPALPGFQSAMASNGAKQGTTLAVPLTATDFTGYAQRLKSAGADAVVLWAASSAVTGIQKAAASMGYHPTWLVSWFSLSDVFKSLGGQPGTYFDAWNTPPQVDTAAIRTYKKALKDSFGESKGEKLVGSLSQQGWTDASVFVAGLKKMFAMGLPPTQANLMKALDTLKDWDNGLAFGITFTPTSHGGVGQEAILQATSDGGFKVVKTGIQLGSATGN
ncbi:MAG: ABC transporter substrate-binding protein [Nocardioidaceae bacterium]